jgi:hypothetical protein
MAVFLTDETVVARFRFGGIGVSSSSVVVQAICGSCEGGQSLVVL